MRKRHLIYATLHFLACFFIVKTFVKNPFIRGFLGDLFFMGFMYHGLKSFYNFDSRRLLLFLLFLAFGVEFCQYFKILEVLGLNSKILRFLFGATFDFWDLIAYTLGTIFVLWEEKWGE